MTREAAHCTFCDLIHGAAEVSICHEDSDSIAFLDIQPVNNGHVLVVPREHYESLADVPQELGLHLFKITMRLAGAITSVTGCNDLNIVVNSGKEAGQDEPHFHVHIIPRREGDGFDVPLPFAGSSMPDRTVLDAYAVQIISALRDPMRGELSAEEPHIAKTKTAPRERVVAVRRFDEPAQRASAADDAPLGTPPRRNGTWKINEGPHGELQYEPVADRPDSA
jgi:histidine triad (HIT) family protein